jgi:hypothetical protein
VAGIVLASWITLVRKSFGNFEHHFVLGEWEVAFDGRIVLRRRNGNGDLEERKEIDGLEIAVVFRVCDRTSRVQGCVPLKERRDKAILCAAAGQITACIHETNDPSLSTSFFLKQLSCNSKVLQCSKCLPAKLLGLFPFAVVLL